MALCLVAVAAAARGLVRHNTWYLASDQFAFLTFADDLRHGHVFHDPSTMALLAGPGLPANAAADAYFQTYIFRDGLLYSRYPPGYPLLLAAAEVVGGETVAHWLNPVLYLVLIVVMGVLAARLAPAAPDATAAATMWALLVIPVEVHYWGITIARDLPAHLLALLAVLGALAGAPVRAGLALGLAASMRPDAILWAPSVALVLPRASRTPATIVGASLAFGVGVLPLFAYNTITQGHPLAFTQGSEFRGAFESALGGGTMLAGASFVSGGGFRLSHFPETFPAHLRYLASSFGVFLWLAAGILVVALRRGLPIGRALGSYVVIGLLFYSCWGHGDPRYLVGVSLSLIALAATALVAVAHGLVDASHPRRGRLVALLVVAALLAGGVLLPRDPARGLTLLEQAGASALVVAAAAVASTRSRPLAPLLPALAFALFGIWRIVAAPGTADGFREADIERARATIESLVPADALVLTSPGLGRPAENWTHYTHAETHYLGELDRLFSGANLVAHRCTLAGRPFFVLLGTTEPSPFTVPPAWVSTREIARRDGDGLRDWFIDPRRAPHGAVLSQVRIGLNLPDW